MRVDLIRELQQSVDDINLSKNIYPKALDIHPVNGKCNLQCVWCIGSVGYKKRKEFER